MNSCMIAHASQKEEDAAREEWFATIDVRRHEREAKEEKKKEQEKLVVPNLLLAEETVDMGRRFYRDWWDLPDPNGAQEKKGRP